MSPRLIPIVLAASLTLPVLSAETPAPDPWQTALAFDYNTAAEGFARLHAASPADARVTVAYASSLLVKQPRTGDNIEKARSLLLAVRTSAPSAGENAILALYLLARIELDHLDPAQPNSARTRLEQLRRDHPAHPLADHAAVELAYLLAYPGTGPAPAAIPAIEALLASVKEPGASRDLHALLANFYLRHTPDPSAALKHLVAARAVGFEQPLRNADTDLSIGNLARETGNPTLARHHYEAFLAAAPRDVRATTVRRLIAQLDGASPTPVPAR
ncbi:MAG: hypothetical protein K0R17_21 [Rariglobus sp.]|jgi:hypothetical protein|nr:hypothetical protein [Rariglobus sp.]